MVVERGRELAGGNLGEDREDRDREGGERVEKRVSVKRIIRNLCIICKIEHLNY
tara:strand:+ start:138 stop:299 length:162 start_codon:yes stop_codon:yes gene_type:complete